MKDVFVPVYSREVVKLEGGLHSLQKNPSSWTAFLRVDLSNQEILLSWPKLKEITLPQGKQPWRLLKLVLTPPAHTRKLALDCLYLLQLP